MLKVLSVGTKQQYEVCSPTAPCLKRRCRTAVLLALLLKSHYVRIPNQLSIIASFWDLGRARMMTKNDDHSVVHSLDWPITHSYCIVVHGVQERKRRATMRDAARQCLFRFALARPSFRGRWNYCLAVEQFSHCFGHYPWVRAGVTTYYGRPCSVRSRLLCYRFCTKI